jgi:hypothetical protein
MIIWMMAQSITARPNSGVAFVGFHFLADVPSQSHARSDEQEQQNYDEPMRHR